MEDTGHTENQKAELILKNQIELLKSAPQVSYKACFSKKLEQDIAKKNSSFALLNQLNNFFIDSNDIDELIERLKKKSFYKRYSKITLFIHEKGNTNASCLSFSDTKTATNISVEDFFKLFNSIKKSKDRSYGSIEIKGSKFDIIGTFLSHEYLLRYHSVILIVGNEDFLPFSKEEKLEFRQISSMLEVFLQIFIEKISTLKKDIDIDKALEETFYKFKFINQEVELYSNTKKSSSQLIRTQISPQSYFLVDFDNSAILNQAESFHQQRVKVLGELFNTLKHELSNPLFGLELSTDLLLMENLAEDQLSFLEQIKISIKNCQNIIENFKDLYSQNDKDEDFDIIALINEVFTLTKSKSRNLRKEIISKEDKVIISSNRSLLAQVFFNLIINSAEACRQVDRPIFQIEIKPFEEYIIIELSDNGPGISNEMSSHIFNPFYTTKNDGTGLGLAISKNLVTKLSGNLKLLKTSKGACFELILPYEYSSY